MVLLDDSIIAIPVFSKVCTYCRHWESKNPLQRRCAAFDQIPDEIWYGENPHTEPYPGDKGIRFSRGLPEDLS